MQHVEMDVLPNWTNLTAAAVARVFELWLVFPNFSEALTKAADMYVGITTMYHSCLELNDILES